MTNIHVYNPDTDDYELVSEEEAQAWITLIDGLNDTVIEDHEEDHLA